MPVRPRAWQSTITSGWLPWTRPSVTPAYAGWNSEPWPSITSQCCGAAGGDSHSAAPETKSDTTESTAMPRPEMKIPVWPVARKSASTPRLRNSFSIASAVYFLPTAQSVPTVRSRRPLRFLPVPGMNDCAGWRTSMRWRPLRFAAAAICGTPSSGSCSPEATSSPASSAETMVEIQDGAMKPPSLAMPMTSVRMPRALASAGVRSGRPRSTSQPGRRNWPAQSSGRHWRMPAAVFAVAISGASPRKRRYGLWIMVGRCLCVRV